MYLALRQKCPLGDFFDMPHQPEPLTAKQIIKKFPKFAQLFDGQAEENTLKFYYKKSKETGIYEFIDLDAEEWSLNGIIDSFSRVDEWDAIFANGLQGEENKYYDLFGYRNLHENIFGGEMLGEYNSPINYSKAIYISPNDANLKTVVSAFGGIGIYIKSLFTDDIQYGCLVTEQIISYYTTILSNTMRIDDFMLKIIAEPCPKFPGGYKTYFKYNNKYHTIHWKNNSGYNNVVLCEHVSVNIPLFFKGYRLRINPKMTYRWIG
jgi:hypothetical protein